MEKKKFHCKIQDLPIITGFVLESLVKDLLAFGEYSNIFNIGYVQSVRAKRLICMELIIPAAIRKQLKNISRDLQKSNADLRLLFNKVEGYVKLAGNALDVEGSDVGMKEARLEISKGNVEGVINSTNSMVTTLRRNETVLFVYGMNTALLDEVAEKVELIDSLNNQQNSLMSDHGRLAHTNIAIFNDLWADLSTILITAKAIYRGVDEIKLRDYTMSHLIKRVNAEGQTEPPVIDPA